MVVITSIAESQRVIKCRAARAAKTSGYQCSTIKTKKKSMLTGLLDDISHALAVGWSNCGLKYPEINFAQFWRRKSAVKLILLPMLQIIKKTTPANLLYENYFQKCSDFLAFLFSNTILTIHSRWSLRHLRRARSESTSNNVKAPTLLRRCRPIYPQAKEDRSGHKSYFPKKRN